MTSSSQQRTIPSVPAPTSTNLNRDVAIWSTVEPGLGLVAAGGATLRPLFRSFYHLSTNRRSTTHPYLPSHPRSKVPSHKPSVSSSNGNQSIMLRNDIVDPMGNVTSIRSPFGDSFEVMGEDGGIKIERTVEVSRVVDSDGEEDGVSGSGSPLGWSERDLV
jgi:hypothetical protein